MISRFLTPLLVVLVPLTGQASLQLFLPVVAPPMMSAVGLEATAYGWVQGAAGLGSMWFFVSSHGINPVFGPVRTLQLGILLAALGAFLAMTAWFPAVLAGAMLMGFGYATTTPSGSQILADHVPRQYWATIFSLRQSGVPLGGVIAGGVGSWLISQWGWREALGAIVLACIVLSAPLALAPRSYNMSRPLKAFRPAALVAPTNLLRPFQVLLLAPDLGRLAIVCIGFAVVQCTTQTFFVIYVHAGLGYGLAIAGWLFAIMQGISVLGRIVFGVIADRRRAPRSMLMGLAAASAAAALLLAGLSPGLGLLPLLAATLFVGISVATWNGLYLAEVARLAPGDRVAEVTAGSTFFIFLVYTLAPPAFGALISRFGYEAAFVVAALGATMSGLTLLLGLSGTRSTPRAS